MKTIQNLVNWIMISIIVFLGTSFVYPDSIPITGSLLGLFMLIRLIQQFAQRPLSGLIFSLSVICTAAIVASSLLKYVGCANFPYIMACNQNQFRALSFGFVAFPSIAGISWIAMALEKIFKHKR